MNENEKVWGRGAIAQWKDDLVVVLTDGKPFHGKVYPYMVETLVEKVVALAERDSLTAPPVVDGHVLGYSAGGGVSVGAQVDEFGTWRATIETLFKKGWTVGWTCDHIHIDVPEAIRCGVRKLDEPVTPEVAAYVEGVLAGRADQ